MSKGVKSIAIDRKIPWGLIVSALTALIVHVGSLGIWFHSDDFQLLKAVRDGGPFGVWSGRGAGFFRPLASMSLWLDGQIWHLNPFGYHLSNLILAMVAAVLVTMLARLLVPNSPSWVAPTAGAIFAAMPAHAEAVEWISCRSDLLATAFGLGALIAAQKRRTMAAGILVAVAFTAKESALMIPVLLALLATRSTSEKRWTPVIVTFIVAIAMVVIRALTLGVWVGGYGGSVGPSAIAPNVGLYLAKAVLPTSVQEAALSPTLGPITAWLLGNMRIVAVVVLIAVVCGLWSVRKLRVGPGTRLTAILFLGFFILALPALPLGMSRYTWEGSRFVYFPSTCLAILLAIGFGHMKKPIGYGLAALLFTGYFWGNFRTMEAWRIAGERGRLSLSALANMQGKVLLLSAPDSYRGAYILRNGTAEGLALLHPQSTADPLVLTTYMSENGLDFPEETPVGIQVNPGPLPLQRVGNSPERVEAFGASSVAIRPYELTLQAPIKLPVGILTSAGFNALR